jgi:hypothetical protein
MKMIVTTIENDCQLRELAEGNADEARLPDSARTRQDAAVTKPAYHRSGNPAKRAAAERQRRQTRRRGRSESALAWLHRRPRWFVPALTVLLTLGGMFLPPVPGAVCLLLVAAFLGWLASLAWPKLTAAGRSGRVLLIGVVVGVAIARLTGTWVT